MSYSRPFTDVRDALEECGGHAAPSFNLLLASSTHGNTFGKEMGGVGEAKAHYRSHSLSVRQP